jgi:hypothetical protein
MKYSIQWYTHEGERLSGSFPSYDLRTIQTLATKQRMYVRAWNPNNEVKLDPRGKEIDLFPWELDGEE